MWGKPLQRTWREAQAKTETALQSQRPRRHPVVHPSLVQASCDPHTDQQAFQWGKRKWTLRTTERGSYRDESVSSSLKYGALVCCHPHRKLLCEVTMKDSKTSANEEAAKQIRTAWDSSMGNTKEARRISHWDHKLLGGGLLGRGKTQNEFIKSKI